MMGRTFGVYCSSGETAYRGDFSEMPEPYRTRLIEAVDEWGDVMVGWGVNELIYSLTRWHDEEVFVCENCGKEADGEAENKGVCAVCGETVKSRPKYGKSGKISRLIMCVGSINRIAEEKPD